MVVDLSMISVQLVDEINCEYPTQIRSVITLDWGHFSINGLLIYIPGFGSVVGGTQDTP